MTTTLTVAAAAVALGAAWFQWDAARSAATQAAADRAALAALTEQVNGARTRLETTRRENAALQRQLADLRAAPKIPVGTPAATTTAQAAAESGEAFLAAHPEMREVVGASRLRTFEANWGSALRTMRLSAAERQRLHEQSVHAAPAPFAITERGSGVGLTVENARQLHEAEARAFWSLLGADRQPAFIEAFALKPVHELAKSAAVAGHAAGEPWRTGQRDAFVEAVRRNGAKEARIVSGVVFPNAKTVSFDAVDWDAVQRELAPTWTSQQLAALETARQAVTARRQLESTMRSLAAPSPKKAAPPAAR